MSTPQEARAQDWTCRRGCGQSFTMRGSRDRHELKQHPRRRDEREAGDAALKNSDLYRKREEPTEKEIKVMIPSGYHKKLHGYKVLTGQTISRMVNEALDAYFREQQKEREETE